MQDRLRRLARGAQGVTDRRDPSPHNDLARYWCDTYQRHVGAKYPFNGGKDGSAIKWLRSIYTDEEIRAYMTAFFAIEDDFIQGSGYSLGVFRGCLPKVIAHVMRQQAPRADMHGHVPPCQTVNDCIAKVLADGKRQRSQAS